MLNSEVEATHIQNDDDDQKNNKTSSATMQEEIEIISETNSTQNDTILIGNEIISPQNKTNGMKYLRKLMKKYMLDENKKPKIHVTISIMLVSFCIYISDTVSDLIVACLYFYNGQTLYGSLVLLFFYLPTILIFLLEWQIRKLTINELIIIVLNLDGFKAFMDIFKKLKEKWDNPDSDVNFDEERIILKVMRTVEAFLESFPQTILQMYLLSLAINAGTQVSVFKYISLYTSIVGFLFTITGVLSLPATQFLCDKKLIETIIIYIWIIFDAHVILLINMVLVLSIMTNVSFIICITLFMAYIESAMIFYKLKDFFRRMHCSYAVFSFLAFVVLIMCSNFHLTQYKEQTKRRFVSIIFYFMLIIPVTILLLCTVDNISFYWPFVFEVMLNIILSCLVFGIFLIIGIIISIIFDLDVVDYDRYNL